MVFSQPEENQTPGPAAKRHRVSCSILQMNEKLRIGVGCSQMKQTKLWTLYQVLKLTFGSCLTGATNVKFSI